MTADARVRVDVLCPLARGNQCYVISYLVPPAELAGLMRVLLTVLAGLMRVLLTVLAEPGSWDELGGVPYMWPLRRLPFDSGPMREWPRAPRLVTLRVASPLSPLCVEYELGSPRPVTPGELTDPEWWDAYLAYNALRGVL